LPTCTTKASEKGRQGLSVKSHAAEWDAVWVEGKAFIWLLGKR
jgi:hypothetical protein